MVRIDNITIAVDNIESIVDFYSNTFNLDLNEIDLGEFSMYVGNINDIQVLFCPKSIAGITAVENTIQIRLVVEKIEETIDKAIRSGGGKLGDIQISDGVKTAAIIDPDGNSIELIQM